MIRFGVVEMAMEESLECVIESAGAQLYRSEKRKAVQPVA